MAPGDAPPFASSTEVMASALAPKLDPSEALLEILRKELSQVAGQAERCPLAFHLRCIAVCLPLQFAQSTCHIRNPPVGVDLQEIPERPPELVNFVRLVLAITVVMCQLIHDGGSLPYDRFLHDEIEVDIQFAVVVPSNKEGHGELAALIFIVLRVSNRGRFVHLFYIISCICIRNICIIDCPLRFRLKGRVGYTKGRDQVKHDALFFQHGLQVDGEDLWCWIMWEIIYEMSRVCKKKQAGQQI